jgi:hypothetical protein
MNAIDAIQDWFQRQCNGEWEHQNGVKIETLDNPGWLVKVDLVGTPLANKEFMPIQNGTESDGWPMSDRWIHCSIRDSVWQGAGDETKLEAILRAFLDWALPL